MKVIIAGSRHLNRIADVIDAIHASGLENDITEIVSGGCPTGPDDIGEWLARVFFDRPIPVKRFPADWDAYGKAAGPIRNSQMANYADALILIWDGKSPGSRSMRNQARLHEIKFYEKVIA